MTIQKSEALVLRKQDLRETSLIVTFFTRDFGKINGIMRGVRGSRGSHGGACLELFAKDDIVSYERKRGGIFTVSQCDLSEFFFGARSSLERLAHAAYVTELLDAVTTNGDPYPDVFDLAAASLRMFGTDASPRRVARIFEIKLLSLLGLMPSVSECANCSGNVDSAARFSVKSGGLLCSVCMNADKSARPVHQDTVKFMQYIQDSPFDRIERVKVCQDVGRELELIMRKFLEFHIERRLKTVGFLNQTC